MASGNRKQTASKRDRKGESRRPARGPVSSVAKEDVTEHAKSVSTDNGTAAPKAAKARPVTKESGNATPTEAAENRVPPALPVPIASFTF